MNLLVHVAFADEAIFFDTYQLLWNRQVLLFQITFECYELWSHRILLAILQLVFFLVEDLAIGLAKMLCKHWNRLVVCLMVECQQMHAKLVVDVLCHCLSLVVLLGCLYTKWIVLNALLDGRSPVLDRGHAFLAHQFISILADYVHRCFVLGNPTPEAMRAERRWGRAPVRTSYTRAILVKDLQQKILRVGLEV